MTISELSAGQGNVNVEGTIGEVGEVKTFNKFGKELIVANAIFKRRFWNNQINTLE